MTVLGANKPARAKKGGVKHVPKRSITELKFSRTFCKVVAERVQLQLGVSILTDKKQKRSYSIQQWRNQRNGGPGLGVAYNLLSETTSTAALSAGCWQAAYILSKSNCV